MDTKLSRDKMYISKIIKNIPSYFESIVQHKKNMTDTMEYYSIEEIEEVEVKKEIKGDLILYVKDEIDDSQSQVSSTENIEIDYDGQDSDPSNILSSSNDEYIIDHTLDNYNNLRNQPTYAAITSDRFNAIRTETEESFTEKNPPINFSRRKIKRNTLILKTSTVPPLACEICGNQFTNSKKKKVHMKVYHHERNYQCGICSKRFTTARNLQVHMRIHTGEKPYECIYCGRRFNDRSSSLRHERTHTNEKPFSCDYCGKAFSLSTTLHNHVKVHTNERSYRCEPCGKSFKLLHHLKTHENTTSHRSVLKIAVLENLEKLKKI